MPMTDQELNSFLEMPLVAVLSTVDESGRPHSAPIWFHWEDGAAYMFTSRKTLKWRNLKHRPYASLCVDWREPPYRSVIMEGTVEEVERPLQELVLTMALRYFGDKKGNEFVEDYRDELPGVVAFRLIPGHIASFNSED